MPKNTPGRIIDSREKPSGIVIAYAGAGGGGSVPIHDITNHTGLLADAQAPQFLMLNGARALTGNLAIDPGVTIDGVDLSAHAADPDAHHAKQHGILSSSDHTVTGSAFQIVGLTATNTLGLLTPSSNPGAAAAILRTDALGNVVVQALGLGASKLHSYDGLVLRNWYDTAYQGIVVQFLTSISGNSYSDAVFKFFNAGGTAHQDVTLKNLGLYGGNINSDNTIQLLNWAANSAQNLRARSLLASSDYSHSSRVPDTGIYSLGGVAIGTPGAITSGYILDVNGAARFRGSIAGDVKLSTPLIDTVSGHMTIAPAVDLLLQPGSNLVKLQSGVALQSHNYASQLTGMRVTAAGEGDFRYLYTDEMHAKSFIADLEQALAGGQIISKSVAMLAQAFTAPAAGGTANLYVEDLPSAANMAAFQSGDIVLVRLASRAGGALNWSNCWGVVTAYTDGNGTNFAEGWQRWTFTRSTGADAGAMAAGTVVQPEAIVLDFGVDGNGYYEVNAIDGIYGLNSPYLQFVRWTGHPATGKAVRLRAGQLRGIFAQDEFGIFAGTGTANTDRYLRLSDYAPGNGINNLPFRLRNNGTTTVEFSSWDNVWLGPSSADKRLLWDGTTLTVKGAIVITAASSGYANMTDRPTSLAGINSAEGTKLEGIAAGATVGATWGGNLDVPAHFEAPVGGTPGLHLTPERMGYWNGSSWKMWMNNAGQFFFGSDVNARLQWDGTTLAGYNAWNAVQWAASAVTGQLTAGGGAVVLDVNGETIYRPTIVITAEIPEPGFGTMPNMSPTAAQALEFRDTAATFYRPGAPYSYDYPGNTLLRIYSSSKHHVPDNLTPAWWTHRIDAVIEVPAITEAGDSAIYTRWLWLKAPTVVVDGVLKVGSNAVWHAGNLVSPLDLNSFSGALRSSGTVYVANLANTAYQNFIAQNITVAGGYITCDNAITLMNVVGSTYQDLVLRHMGLSGGNINSDNTIQLLNWAANSAQNLRARSLLASNDYSHYSRVPETGIYSLGGVAIGTPGAITSGYILDVNGAARFRGSIAANAHINLSPIAEPATSAATGILWMGTDNKLYFKKPSGTAILVAG